MIHILLVDDHPSVMEGTRLLLEQEADMKVMLANGSGQAVELSRAQRFDVLLIDLHMPDENGIELAKRLLKITPDAAALIYTGFEINNHFDLMIEAGISGFLLKTACREQLVAAVRCALRGEAILPVALVRQLQRTKERVAVAPNEDCTINGKEYEILREITKGRSNKDIAETMFMSQRSLEYSITNLFHKLNVKSRMEAAIKAKQMGLFVEYLNEMTI
jgi:two-component system, NarL family, competent response regulator ComA